MWKAKLSFAAALAVMVTLPGAVAAQDEPTPQSFTFSAAPSVSSIYAVCAGIASLWEQEIPGTSITVTEGGTVSNVVRLAKGQAQMAYSKPAALLAAHRGGAEPFEEPLPNVLAVAGITGGPLHIVIDGESGITSFDQIVEQKYPLKISAGRKGYSSEVFLQQILEGYGLDYDTIASWGGEVRFVDMGAGISAMQDGQLNAVITPDILPHPGVTQITETRDVNLVSLPDEIIAELVDKYGYVKTVLPGGMYRGNPDDVQTIDDPYILIAREDMPADFVERAVRTFLSPEGREYLSAISPQLGEVSPEESYAMLGSNKLHPGAEAYFREAGILE